jgi:hypothetical protein
LEQAENAPTYLLCDRKLIKAFRWQALACPVCSLQADDLPAGVADDRGTGELLARLDKLPDDVAYLALPRALGVAPVLDRTLSVIAQGVLRAFAWRLPGFADSSLPYLYANFLEFAGSIEDTQSHHVVSLGKPPLHLVLNITGMARATYSLSWLDERPFALWTEWIRTR